VPHLFVTVEASRWLEARAADIGLDARREAFRLGLATSGGLTATPDAWHHGDVVVRGETRPIVILDDAMAEAMDEGLLDLDGEALSVLQAKETCEGRGCVQFMLETWPRRRS
jgi:hypothetical protein